jgi:hypothetical protein
MKYCINIYYCLLAGILAIFLLSSCGAANKASHFTTQGGQIPPDFKGFKDTLLVLAHPEDVGYDHYLRKNFEGNYTGPYKIIRIREINSYNPNNYQYVFDHSLNNTTKNYSGAAPSHTYASSDVFFIRDRQKKIDYVTKSSAYYSKLMRAYIKALDGYRQGL